MKRFLLDTGIASDFINRRHNVFERAREEVGRGNRIGIGTPVLGELFGGIEISVTREKTFNGCAEPLPFGCSGRLMRRRPKRMVASTPPSGGWADRFNRSICRSPPSHLAWATLPSSVPTVTWPQCLTCRSSTGRPRIPNNSKKGKFPRTLLIR